jgi:hypothetical protein
MDGCLTAAPLWPGIRSWEVGRHGGAGGVGVEITLDRREVFDVVAGCEEVVELAERAAQSEIAFMVEGVRRFLLGRLTGSPGGLDG